MDGDVGPNEAGFWWPADLRSAGRLFCWMLDRVRVRVTERHNLSQAVREMNAHTVQHGSLGGVSFFCLLFLLFRKPESIQHNPRRWVRGIYTSGSCGEEDVLERSFKSLDCSRNETVATSKK